MEAETIASKEMVPPLMTPKLEEPIEGDGPSTVSCPVGYASAANVSSSDDKDEDDLDALCRTTTAASIREGTSRHGSRVMSKDTTLPLRKEISVVVQSGNVSDYYKVESTPFACGSVGEIFRGKTLLTNEVRAVKTIQRARIEEAGLFDQELEIAKLLRHPNVICLYDIIISSDDECINLVTDFYTGGDMFDVIADHFAKWTAVPETTLARFAVEMLQGIKYCHHHAFCHRDIKPENYMLESKQKTSLKLMDFGLACQFTPNDPMTLECGTPAHMAPEVYRRSYDHKCDIWSIGTTFHQLCVGRAPFHDKDMYKQRDTIIRNPDVADFLNRPDFQPRWDVVKGDKESIHGLIKQLVLADPNIRPDARDILSSNQWLKDKGSGEAQAVDEGELHPKTACCTLL